MAAERSGGKTRKSLEHAEAAEEVDVGVEGGLPGGAPHVGLRGEVADGLRRESGEGLFERVGVANVGDPERHLGRQVRAAPAAQVVESRRLMALGQQARHHM